MSFANAQLFWILFVPFVLFAILILTNKPHLFRLFKDEIVQKILASDEDIPFRVRQTIILSAIFLMLVALARPIKPMGESEVEIRGIPVLIALDISASMRSKDNYPNRLTFAKKKIETMLDQLPSDEVALIAFAADAFIIAPFSSDKAGLKLLLEGVDDSYINDGATDFDALIESAKEFLREKNPKVMIIVSDGGEKEQIKRLKASLKEMEITPYAVLVGTQKGAPVLDSSGSPIIYQGKMAITKRNDMLGNMAKALGGDYVVAKAGDQDVQELIAQIKKEFGSTTASKVKIKQQKEYFYYPLLLAILLLLLGFSSLPRRSAQ